MELAEVVTHQHATEVVEVLKASLFDAMTDEFGNIDFSRSSGLSKAKQVNHAGCILRASVAAKTGKCCGGLKFVCHPPPCR